MKTEQDNKKKSNNFKKPANMRKKKKEKRTCLRCDKEFLSEGIHNRICHNCRDSNANVHSPEPTGGYIPGNSMPPSLK